jgi:FKBP-type peptidyl-prolyl cis-trans isomerase 2
MKVKQGDKVKVEYEGKLENGEVFDSSEKQGHPITFEVGAHQVVPGFEKAVDGMDKGEEKEVTLQPEEAYGKPNPEMTRKFPKDKLPKEPEPKVGMMVALASPDGRQIPALISEVGETEVTLDLNHPLAGKVLKFKIKVVGINDPEEKTEGHKDHDCDCGHDH